MADTTKEPGQIGSGVAYIHPQGINPSGMYIREDKVESLVARGIISQCDDCGSEDPDFPAYNIDGDDDEEIENLGILEKYEVRI